MQEGAMDAAPYIIAGGGIAGLATALALAPAPTLVLEKSRGFVEVGAGLQLGPNAVRALQKLGAWDAVEPFTSSPPEIHVWDGLSGKLLKRIRLGEEFEKRYGAPYRVIHRADLHAALLSVARKLPQLKIRADAEVASWRDSASGIEVFVASANHIHGRFLFGCDGVNSSLRRAAVPRSTALDSGFTLHRALIDIPRAEGGIAWECINLWLGPGAHAVHYPVGAKQKLNIVATARNGVALSSAFVRTASALQQLLAAPRNWLPWPGRHAPPLHQWQFGSMLLLGDAAHGTLPFLAQGAAMALEDAAFLKHHKLPPTTGDSDWQERRQRTARLHAATLRTVKHYHATGPHALLRNIAIGSLSASCFTNRLSWIYEG
jgi:2-polyprenyl-6-methoxyphenol hydroxylase-like FAD-dependent oxidoreductase